MVEAMRDTSASGPDQPAVKPEPLRGSVLLAQIARRQQQRQQEQLQQQAAATSSSQAWSLPPPPAPSCGAVELAPLVAAAALGTEEACWEVGGLPKPLELLDAEDALDPIFIDDLLGWDDLLWTQSAAAGLELPEVAACVSPALPPYGELAPQMDLPLLPPPPDSLGAGGTPGRSPFAPQQLAAALLERRQQHFYPTVPSSMGLPAPGQQQQHGPAAGPVGTTQAAELLAALPSVIRSMLDTAPNGSSPQGTSPSGLGNLSRAGSVHDPAAAPAAAGAAGARGGRRSRREPQSAEESRRRRAQAEAQRRYLHRRKEKMQEMEEQVDLLATELAALRMANESERLREESYAMMLGYKEDLLAALAAGRQAEALPGYNLSPETLAYLSEWNAGGILTPAVVLRYAVNGCTDNMDEQGLPRSAPAFELVAEDYKGAVDMLRGLLTVAEASGREAVAALEGGIDAVQELPPIPHGHVDRDLPPWRLLVAAQQRSPASWRSSGDTSSQGLDSQGEASSDDASGEEQVQQGRLELQRHRQQEGLGDPKDDPGSEGSSDMPRLGTALRVVASRAFSIGSSGSSSLNEGRMPAAAQPLSSKGEGCCSCSSDEAVALFLQESKLRGSDSGGLLLRSGDKCFHFSPKQLVAAAMLIARVGALLWQQAVLFPENMLRAFVSQLDTGESSKCMAPGHWEAVMSELHLSPEQLHLLVALHQEYAAEVAGTAARRKAATQQLQQLQDQMARAVAAGLAQDVSSLGLAARDAAAQLERCVHEDNAAEVKFVVGLIKSMHFPLQFCQLFVLSWPSLPKGVPLATIAASLLRDQERGELRS